MPLRRLPLLLIVLACGMAGRPSSAWTSPVSAGTASASRSVAAGWPASVSTSTSRPQDVATLRAWRYRLKSILSESDHRIVLETEFGTDLLADRPDVAASRTRPVGRQRTIQRLRC